MELNLAAQVLEFILLGMPGSPLRKALIESNLGEDLAGGGLGRELRQMYFSTGLKGVARENEARVEDLIIETLTGLAREGIDPHTVEAALNTTEFALRENNTGSFPRGLSIMLRSLTTWLYEADPLSPIAFERPLGRVKSDYKTDKTFFSKLIDRFFLKNPHRTKLTLRPDPGLGASERESEEEALKKAKERMSSEKLQEIIVNTRELKRIQETPDSPESLATIPCLTLADLEKKNKTIPLNLSEERGCRTLYHDLFTNGIAYLDLGFNLHTLPQKYLPYGRLFGRALLEMGTEEEDYVTLTQRISRKTGGIRPSFFLSVVKDAEQGATWMFLRGKAMTAQASEMLDILRDVLLTVRLDNRERFRQMVLESKARQERSLIPGGHQTVNIRLRAHFNEADWVNEQITGISYLFFLRKLAKEVEDHWPKVLEDLLEIRRILINRNAMLLNVTLDRDGWSSFQPRVKEFIETVPAFPVTISEWRRAEIPRFEGMTIPAQVNYVGKGINLYQSRYAFHGSAHVICRFLRNTYLWERVRVQGGAYGAMCSFDRLSGTLTMVSYRDPNLIKTLESFDQAGRFLRELALSQSELSKGVIGTIGDIDQYRLPDAKGYVSMLRQLTGESDEDRQEVRDQVLASSPEDFASFAGYLEVLKSDGLVKVLGSEDALREPLKERPGWLQVTKVL